MGVENRKSIQGENRPARDSFVENASHQKKCQPAGKKPDQWPSQAEDFQRATCEKNKEANEVSRSRRAVEIRGGQTVAAHPIIRFLRGNALGGQPDDSDQRQDSKKDENVFGFHGLRRSGWPAWRRGRKAGASFCQAIRRSVTTARAQAIPIKEPARTSRGQ